MGPRDLKSVLRLLWNRKLIIAAAVAVAIAAAVLAARSAVPTYQASSRILIIEVDDANRGAFGQVDVLTQVEILSSTTLERVLEEAPGAADVIDVTAEQVAGTSLIEVTVAATEPEVAARIANTVAESYVEQREQSALGRVERQAERARAKAEEITTQLEQTAVRIQEEETTIATREGEIAAARQRSATTGIAPDAAELTPPSTALLESLQVRYDDLSRRLESVNEQIDEFEAELGQSPPAQVIEAAEVPEVPAAGAPVRTLVLAGLLGLALGTGLVLLLDLLDSSVRSPADVKRVVPRVPALALARPRRLLPERLGRSADDALRGLASQILLARPQERGVVVLVTGAAESAPVTSSVVGLSRALLGLGADVTAVDCDLEDPRLAGALDLGVTVEEPDATLGRDRPTHGALQTLETTAGSRLRLLPAQRARAGALETLSSETFGERLRALARDVDVVLLDASPLRPTLQALALARVADASVVVVAAGRTDQSELEHAVVELDAHHLPLLAVLVASQYERPRRRTVTPLWDGPGSGSSSDRSPDWTSDETSALGPVATPGARGSRAALREAEPSRPDGSPARRR